MQQRRPQAKPRQPHRTWRTIAFVIGLSACSAMGTARAADPFAENVRTTDPLTPAEQLGKFHLPPGFEIQLVAAEPDIHKPMNLAFDSLGRLWVTTSIEYPWAAPTNRPARDRLMIFEDFGPDGRARKVTEFAGALNIPIGIYPFRSPASAPLSSSPGSISDSHLPPPVSPLTWKAIVWSIPNIWLMEDTDGDGKTDRREVLYGPFDTTRDTHGNQASFRRGFDGWLYATHGFNNDSHVQGRDGHEVHFNSGNTYRIRLDGSRIEHHTHGQVNPFGLAWDPRGNLYSSDCHSAPIYQLLAGGTYPSFGKPHDGLGFAPTLMEHSHGSTAIDGMFYCADDRWPAEFRDNVFIGNVMTSRLNRDRLEFNGSTPTAIELPDFLTCDDPWFRPVDNVLGPDGALYIADFYNRIIGHYEVPLDHPGRDRERGRIWRVVYRGEDPQSQAPNPKLPDELADLVTELRSPNLTRRMFAMNEITDRFPATAGIGGDDFGRAFLQTLERSSGTPPAVPRSQEYFLVHALWILDRLGRLDDPSLNRAANAGTLVRVHALRLVTERGIQRSINPQREGDRFLPLSLTNLVLNSLADPDALVRRCAAEALGAWPAIHQLRPLLDLLTRAPTADTHLHYVVRKAIRDHLHQDDLFRDVLARDWNDVDLAVFADVALAVNTPLAGRFLIAQLRRATVDRETASRWLRHAARYAPAEEMDTLAALARNQIPTSAGDELGAEFEAQLALFQSVEEGLQQRGVPLPAQVRAWGSVLATNILSAEHGSSWVNTALEDTGENPWEFEERRRPDGTPIRVLSSFPRGEQLIGSLRSPEFELPDRLSFWLCGHDGFPGTPAQKRNVVRLRLASDATTRNGDPTTTGTDPVIAEVFAPRNDTAKRIQWEMTANRGRRAYLEVTDADAGKAFAWVAFGDFEPPVLRLPALAPSTTTRQLVAAADLARRLDLQSLVPQLTVLARNPVEDIETRGAAFVALAHLVPQESRRALGPALTDAEIPAIWRRRLLEASLVESTQEEVAALGAVVREAPYRVQLAALRAGAGSHDLAREFLDAIAIGKLPARLLQDRLVRKRMETSLPDEAQRIAQLTSTLPPPSQALEQLIAERRIGFDAKQASAPDGRLVFEKNCAACHQVGGKGGLIGPQLDGIGQRGLERIIEDVLDPNRNVDRAFRSHMIFLRDGEVLSGLPRREEGELLVLADSTGKEISVPTRVIQERRESEMSPMPENWGEVLPTEDFNDLLAFLLAQVVNGAVNSQ